MKTEMTVFFRGEEFPGGARAILDAVSCGSDVATLIEYERRNGVQPVSVHVRLDTTDGRLDALLELLAIHNVNWSFRREDFFTDEELNQAPLIVVEPTTTYYVYGGPILGTLFDMKDACPKCGSGARQTSALFIHGDDLPKLKGRRIASTCYHDIIVDERLAEELERIDPVGLSFRNTYAVMPDKRQIKLHYRQLRAARSLPPMSPRSTGMNFEKPCPSCRRSGFTTGRASSLRPVYRAEDLTNIDDVNTTWEWFGEAKFDGDVSDALFPYPRLLVTPKVMRVLRDPADKTFNWLAVRVEDDNAV